MSSIGKMFVVIACGMFFCLNCVLAEDGQSNSPTIETEIRALESKNASEEPNTLRALIADDYIMVGLDGSTNSKDDVINAGSAANKPKIALHINQIKEFQGSAVVIGSASLSSQDAAGHAVNVEVNYTNVWMKRSGKWQLVSSHVSPLHPVSAEMCLSQPSP
jgi:ketosteroid isomerase-like protein